MDGYALSAGQGPWSLVGESRAGAPFTGALRNDQCVRISTGAIVPDGAISVLLQEDAVRVDDSVSARQAPAPGRHIRPCGFDFRSGDVLFTRGARMTAGRIALALTAGHSQIPVTHKPRVTVIDSGDELTLDPATCLPHQVPASNSAMIAAMLAPLGCDVTRIGPVPDNQSALGAAFAQSADADVVIISGGASVGDHDLVQPSLLAAGAQVAFWKVAIKPGKPLLVASRQGGRGRQVVLGLPGNPVSSFVTAFLFALPLIKAIQGDPAPFPKTEVAFTGEDLPATGSRREFLRGVREGNTVRLAGSQDSSALSALAQANCLINRAAFAPALQSGEPVMVFNLQNG